MIIRTHRSTKSAPELPKEEVKAPIVQSPIVEKQERIVKKVEKAIAPATHSGLVPEEDEEDSEK